MESETTVAFSEAHKAKISEGLRRHWDTPQRRERDDKVVELYRSGMTEAQVSASLNIPRTTVSRILSNARVNRHRNAPRTKPQLDHLEKLRRTWCLCQENFDHLQTIRKPQNLKQRPDELKPSKILGLSYQERLAMFEVTNRPETPRFENDERAALAEKLVSRFVEGETPKDIAASEKKSLATVEDLIREWMLARNPLGKPGRAERVRRRIIELASLGLTSLAIKVRLDLEFPSRTGRCAATGATIRRVVEESLPHL